MFMSWISFTQDASLCNYSDVLSGPPKWYATRVKWVEISHRTVWCKEVTWPPDSVETEALLAIFCSGLIRFDSFGPLAKGAFAWQKMCTLWAHGTVKHSKRRNLSFEAHRYSPGRGYVPDLVPILTWNEPAGAGSVGSIRCFAGALGQQMTRVPIHIGGILKPLLKKKLS